MHTLPLCPSSGHSTELTSAPLVDYLLQCAEENVTPIPSCWVSVWHSASFEGNTLLSYLHLVLQEERNILEQFTLSTLAWKCLLLSVRWLDLATKDFILKCSSIYLCNIMNEQESQYDNADLKNCSRTALSLLWFWHHVILPSQQLYVGKRQGERNRVEQWEELT